VVGRVIWRSNPIQKVDIVALHRSEKKFKGSDVYWKPTWGSAFVTAGAAASRFTSYPVIEFYSKVELK
jgi:hypothetical protein